MRQCHERPMSRSRVICCGMTIGLRLRLIPSLTFPYAVQIDCVLHSCQCSTAWLRPTMRWPFLWDLPSLQLPRGEFRGLAPFPKAFLCACVSDAPSKTPVFAGRASRSRPRGASSVTLQGPASGQQPRCLPCPMPSALGPSPSIPCALAACSRAQLGSPLWRARRGMSAYATEWRRQWTCCRASHIAPKMQFSSDPKPFHPLCNVNLISMTFSTVAARRMTDSSGPLGHWALLPGVRPTLGRPSIIPQSQAGRTSAVGNASPFPPSARRQKVRASRNGKFARRLGALFSRPRRSHV